MAAFRILARCILITAMVAGAVTLGCQAGSAPTPAGSSTSNAASDLSQLVGAVEIDGSSTVFPISEAVASEFREQLPNVKVTVAVSGTGGGFKRFTKGEIDIADASRPIKPAEFQQCVENGVSFLELPVAYDGLTVVVNPANDWVKQLSVDDLKTIFLESSASKTWKNVNADWPETPIKVYAPGTDSGTFDYFKEVMGEDAMMRRDMSTNEDDNVLVTGVAGEKGAIGFFGVAYYEENKEKLRAVPIVNPKTNQAVSPEPAAIESGEYAPLSRPLFIYVREASLKRPEVRKFVEFYLSNAKGLAAKVGYVGLADELYSRVTEHYDNRLTGTHYLTPTGASREGGLPEVYAQVNLRPVQ